MQCVIYSKILYYVYRPLTIAGVRPAGMQFYIGPHKNMEIIDLQNQYEELKEKVTRLGRFL